MTSLALEANTKFAEINANKIAYRLFGVGTPIVFCNRFRGVLDTWDPLFLDSLARHHQILIFDYPGIGDSTGEFPTDINSLAQEVILLLDYLSIDKFIVLGWSFGGLVAQTITFQFSKRILSTILIGTNPPGRNEVPFEPAFFQAALKPINDLDDEVILFFEPNSAMSRQAAKESHLRIGRRLNRSKIPSSQLLFQRYFAASAGFKEDKENFRSKYANIQTPVLIIMGDHDISFSVENWFPLLRKMSNTQLIILPASGHGPQHQYPELVKNYMNAFLKENTWKWYLNKNAGHQSINNPVYEQND